MFNVKDKYITVKTNSGDEILLNVDFGKWADSYIKNEKKHEKSKSIGEIEK